ncbi:hypothetical protein [Clostridium sp. AM58-1XD]|uniref:hypothetical protein n=1 Tax=Clostridium sp. AM58-1XD TaxID=2292307 RepID=UPI000E5094BA|nr:hypothetical protein [Clostridium sp. AM58-1XD]RGY97156.1 hypothetical protein DXA13_15400 [Clostridium sp. AM58-1XD]
MRYRSGNRSFYKSKNHTIDIKKSGFWYITLPLFLFMLAYRTAECVLHRKLDRETSETIPEKRGGCRIIDRSACSSSQFFEKKPVEKPHTVTPLEKEPVKTEFIPPVQVGKPAGQPVGECRSVPSVTITEGL